MSSVWDQVEGIFHVAIEMEGAARSAYLDDACRGNESIRREVESLVTAFESERDFMERPAMSLGMRLMAGGEAGALAGRTVGRYKILRPLGRGGMGEVYLAEDERLERQVALKFVTGAFTDDRRAREQLTREARAAAQLEHPNICAIHGIEETAGHNFIVMQYVEGETLASVLRAGPLTTARAFDIAEQIAYGLAAASARGVVHRDIKPQNVIITAGGQAKVLDFGLARFVHTAQTTAPGVAAAAGAGETLHAGLVVGTVAYMSPEQARGEDLDPRTDIFSLGVILYELFAGAHPFRRDGDEATLAAVEREEPPPFSGPPPVSEGLNRLVGKCVAKERAERYRSADELLTDLRSLRERYRRAHAPSRARLLASRLRRYAFPATVFLLALFVMAAIVYHRATRVRTLAVLPFTNAGADDRFDYVGEGLMQSLADRLSNVSTLRVKAPTLGRAGDAQGLDPVGVGREAGAEAVLIGEMVTEGEARQLRTKLLKTSDGSALWERTFDVMAGDVLAVRDEVVRGTAAGMGLWLSEDEWAALMKRQSDSLDAQKFYMKGRYYWNRRSREEIAKAIEMFEHAIEADPTYAQAYAGLADACVFRTTVAYGADETSEMVAMARRAAKLALEADPMLCEAHVSQGVVKMRLDWDWREAEREFRRAIELKPDYAPAHSWYALLLLTLGRHEEALRESEAAREFDPFSPSTILDVGRTHYFARRPDEAARYFHELLGKNPGNRNARYMLGLNYIQQGMYHEAIGELSRLYDADPLYAAAPLGFAYAKWGRRDEALRMLDSLDDIARGKDGAGKGRKVPPQERAIIHLGLGDRDRALAYLEEAFRDRFFPLTTSNVEPIFDDLRADPRFADLVTRMNLTPRP